MVQAIEKPQIIDTIEEDDDEIKQTDYEVIVKVRKEIGMVFIDNVIEVKIRSIEKCGG